jgi:hypothetical protein
MMGQVFTNPKRDQNWGRNIFYWYEKKLIKREKKIFTHFKERMVKKDKIKCPPQVMCGGDIKKIVKYHFILNINEFDI